MTRAKPSCTPNPRFLDDFQVAARLGHGEGWLRNHRPELEAAGFPRYDELLNGTDGNAIEAFMDRRSGLAQAANEEQALLDAINDKG